MLKKGFTLIEILFVIVVIAILAAIVLPRLTETATQARENACDANVANINTQIERYYFKEGSWPSQNLSEMVPPATYDYFPDGLPDCPVTSGEPYEMDPDTNRVKDIEAAGVHDHTP